MRLSQQRVVFGPSRKEIAVCKLLRGWWSYGPKPFLFCPLYVFIDFSAAFCTRIVPQILLGIMRHRNVHYYYYYYLLFMFYKPPQKQNKNKQKTVCMTPIQ